MIYGNLRPYGVPLAVTVSALLFALMHGNIAQTFYTFVAGVVMALCYELSGSIWCSTFLHLFNNLSACVAQILLARLGEGAEMLLYVIDLSVMVAGTAAALALLLFSGTANRIRPSLHAAVFSEICRSRFLPYSP